MAYQNVTFDNMLKEVGIDTIMHNSLMDYDYLLSVIDKDNTWKEGPYVVPFVGATPITVKKGFGLVDLSEVQDWETVKGYINEAIPFTGALVFKERDILRHENATVKDTWFRKIIGRQIKLLISRMRSLLSTSILNGYVARAISTGTNTGLVAISNIESVSIGDRFIFREETTPAAVVGYIKSIDLETNTIEVVDGADFTTAAPVDFTALGAGFNATNGKLYVYGDVNITTGALENVFQDLRRSLLMPAHGGDATIHGIDKADYPFLQALNLDGSGITGTNILEEIFKMYSLEVARKTRNADKGISGVADTLVVGSKVYASIMMKAYDDDTVYYTGKASKKYYPYEVIKIGSTKGKEITVAEVPEMDNDIMIFINPKTMKFVSMGDLGRRGNLDGSGARFHYVRDVVKEHLYVYDVGIEGNLAVLNPQANAIVHSIPDIL